MLIKPKGLTPGDTIAILSTSAPTAAADLDPFERGIALLEKAGYRVQLMPHVRDKQVYLAGSDADRLSDLQVAFSDPSIHAILCARGGYGAMRLLDKIDWALIRKNPKPLIGFSDLTAFHIACYQQTGVVGFYGPMLTSNLIHDEPDSLAELLKVVTGTAVPYDIKNLNTYECFQPGITEGPLTGGNLSLLTSLCGTPYQPKTDGHILFIEDWHEKHYTLDRQFQQLRLAGLLDKAAGILLCDFSEIEPEADQTLTQLLRDLTRDLNIPIGFGFSVGHGKQTSTLPYGVKARFDSKAGKLTILESPIS